MKSCLRYLVGLLVLAPQLAGAQASDLVPGLRRALAHATTDTARARLYVGLSEMEEIPTDSVPYLSRQAIPLLRAALPRVSGAERRRLLRLLGLATKNLALFGYRSTDFEMALRLYKQAAHFSKLGGDTENRVGALYSIGQIKIDNQGDYVGALRIFRQAVREGRGMAGSGWIVGCLSGIGDIYGHLGDTTAALQSKEQAVASATLSDNALSDNTETLIMSLLELADSYLSWRDDTAQAERCVQRVPPLIAKLPATQNWTGDLKWTLGRIRLREARWTEARVALLQALAQYEKHGESIHQVPALTLLARVEEQLHHLPLALRYAQQANRKLGTHRPLKAQEELEEVLARLYEKLHQPQQALNHYRRFIGLRDSLRNEANLRAAYQERLRGEYAVKEATLRARQTQREAVAAAEARQQQQRLWGLVAVLAALLLGLGVATVLALRLRRSRNELAAARATQDRLYAVVAHDLRSPVTAFEGLSGLLDHYVRRQDTAALAGLGGLIHQAAHSLRGLLENLLHWALHQRGELVAHPQAVAVADVLAEAIALYQATALAADITLTQETPDAQLRLWADAQMSRTIVRNLVGNALKATPTGGRVTLTAAVAAGAATIQVTDTGPGFGEEQLSPGQRTGARRAQSAADRAGLGLLLSRTFAQAQGGTLALRNAPGGGAVASLTLPLAGVDR